MKGFSLVELSIVLVILGLLTGGILAGQNLIRAAELRSVTTEYQSYITAVQTFRDKYFALPGDMNNATNFWGTSANCPGNASQGNSDSLTCDGDGDGIIHMNTSTSREPFRFWQQLANAGLMEGSYSGVSGADSYNWAVTDDNSPKAKLGMGLWSVHTHNSDGNFTPQIFRNWPGTFLLLGGPITGNPNLTYLLTPEELWNIDTKMDDGQAVFGKLMGNVACTDASSNTDLTSDYDLDDTATVCFATFRQAL